MTSEWEFEAEDDIEDKMGVSSELTVIRRLVDIDDGVEHYFVTDGARLLLISKFSLESMYRKAK